MITWLKDKWIIFLARAKRAHKSMTVWFAVVGVPVLTDFLPYAKDHLPEVKQFIPVAMYDHVGLIITVAVLALRFKTTKAMEHK